MLPWRNLRLYCSSKIFFLLSFFLCSETIWNDSFPFLNNLLSLPTICQKLVSCLIILLYTGLTIRFIHYVCDIDDVISTKTEQNSFLLWFFFVAFFNSNESFDYIFFGNEKRIQSIMIILYWLYYVICEKTMYDILFSWDIWITDIKGELPKDFLCRTKLSIIICLDYQARRLTSRSLTLTFTF